ncbi:WD40 repeat, partial [Brachionus plicatilis]
MEVSKVKNLWGKWNKKRINFAKEYNHPVKGENYDFPNVSNFEILQNGNIVSGSADKTIKIWDKDIFKCLKTINGHNDSVRCLAIMQNGNIVSGSGDITIKIWDKDTFECLKTIYGHIESVVCLAIMQNGNIVSGSVDKTIKIWDKDTFE